MRRLVIDGGVLGNLGATTRGLGAFARIKKVWATAQYVMNHLNSVSSQMKTSLIVEGSDEVLERVSEVLTAVGIGYRIEEAGED